MYFTTHIHLNDIYDIDVCKALKKLKLNICRLL
jgi:hypothetical protein